MRVVKIIAEGFTTSFRYPHFMLGVQPTYEMPPPATLYGHIASALGQWFDPKGVQFALRFTYAKKVADVENTILLTPSTGQLAFNRKLPKILEGTVNPFKREILFFPRLTLYINRPEWETSFKHPRFAVCLGRSHDLVTYRSISIVELEPAKKYYLEHTLLPYEYSSYTAAGQSVLMPRFIDYNNKRYPSFDRYVVLHRRVHSHNFIYYEGQPELEPCWIDPTEPLVDEDSLGVVFLSWI